MGFRVASFRISGDRIGQGGVGRLSEFAEGCRFCFGGPVGEACSTKLLHLKESTGHLILTSGFRGSAGPNPSGSG